MLRVLGSARKLCDGMTRRDLLRMGGLGLAGLTLAELASWQAAGAVDRRRTAEIVRPRQVDHPDPPVRLAKPDRVGRSQARRAAGNSRRAGLDPLQPAGLRVCELLPNFAKVMDRTTVLRSMTHPYPLHGVAFALTGVPTLDLPAELNPRDPRNWPFFGSVVDYVEAQRERAGQAPRAQRAGQHRAAVQVFSSRRTGEVPRSGPYATFLGAEFDPVWTDYVGTATKGLAKTLAGQTFDDNDPYIGLSAGQPLLCAGRHEPAARRDARSA